MYGLPNNLLHKFQRVQHAAARLICNLGRFDHITTTLFSLHWPPIRYRIQFKISLFTYKALNGLAPSYITELLKRKTIPRYNLRSSDDKLLLQHPNIRTLATLGDRSFTAASPKLWNDLPVVIRHAINVAAFKRLLKPIYLGKRIAASRLFPFYCLEESDTQFFVSLFWL